MAFVKYWPIFIWHAILNISNYFSKAIYTKTKTKHFSGLRYVYSITTKWVSIEKY